jgi:mRNA-degrading endonuclease RelE of RelBE toxin-antitoxin system
VKVLTSPTFERHAKKLHKHEKKALDLAVREVAQDPSIGEAKRGDLAGVYVYKFKNGSQHWLLAYTVESVDQLTLRLVGPHENFYKGLKRSRGI